MTDIYCRFHESDLIRLTELNLSRSEIIVYLHFKVSSMSDKFQKIIKCTRKDLEEKLKLSKATVNRVLKKLSRLGLITLNEAREKVVGVVSPTEMPQKDSHEEIGENHTALKLSNQDFESSAIPTEMSSEGTVDIYDDSEKDSQPIPQPIQQPIQGDINSSALVTEPANKPVEQAPIIKPNALVAKPAKKEKPRIPERLIIPKLKQKLGCEYHPLKVLESITNCHVYLNSKRDSLRFQHKRNNSLVYVVNVKQLIDSLPSDCDSETIRSCIESIKSISSV